LPEGLFILSLDITERRRAAREQQIMFEVLLLVNESKRLEPLLESILERLKHWSQCEAVGIRLKDGPDFPYYVTSGFPGEFVQMENRPCSYDENGCVVCDMLARGDMPRCVQEALSNDKIVVRRSSLASSWPSAANKPYTPKCWI
jgi:transcriptional regulator with GAF, ATPase, and Fis domain